MRIEVEGKTRLNGFKVEEFTSGGGGRWRREEEGGGEAGGDKSFAERSVGAPDHVGWIRERKG